jgi:hypothetical protein
VCGKIPEKSSDYHFQRDCPVSTTPTTAVTENPRRDRQRTSQYTNRDNQYTKKQKIVHYQEESNNDP